VSKRAKPIDIDARVAIATCSNVAEAAMVRTLLASHGIVATVSGENHAAALGGLAGSLISLRVQVAVSDAEEAKRLIDQMRTGSGVSDQDLDEEALAAGAHADPDLLREVAHIESTQGSRDFGTQLSRKRRSALAALLSVTLTFGTGHAAAGSGFRAILLAGIEFMGIRYLFSGQNLIGGALVIGAILLDLIGSQRLLWTAAYAAALPAARIRP
jgi:Putative prokaryotic signal transducing protein